MTVNLDIGIDLGTKYLTNVSAYFLGAILASDECVIRDKEKYWVAPVRHNKSGITNVELEQHFNNIKKLAQKNDKTTIMTETIILSHLNTGKFSRRMVGFGTFFKSPIDLELENIVPTIKNALFASSKEVQQCFLIGMFDGRGAFDINKQNGKIRYLSLDCANSNLGEFLSEVIENYGLRGNYNTSRERLEGGEPRKDQLRIKGNENFQEEIGFISSQKINRVFDLYDKEMYEIVEKDEILFGLKQIRRKLHG